MTEAAVSPPVKPRRSVLYMPGSNVRALEKAKTLAADALILDLEDAVAPDAKAEARDQVCAAVSAGGYGAREIIIRVNGLETDWGRDDLSAVAKVAPDAVLVPKVNNAHDVRQYEALMNEDGMAPSVALWAMMETPLAMLNVHEIAAVAAEPGSRLSGWVMGTNDLAKEVGLEHTPERLPLIAALSMSILAARAYGLVIFDGVYNDIQNEDGFAAVCRQGREMGFDGKTLIHPKQLDPCNEAFKPSEAAVAFARQVIATFALPENQSKGALKVEGQMVERLHAEIAEKTVAIAEAIAAREADV